MREAFGHTLPKNLARLKVKMSTFKKDGYPSLISGKIGNKNTVKITEEAEKKPCASADRLSDFHPIQPRV